MTYSLSKETQEMPTTHEIPADYRLSTYEYELPQELIAQEPVKIRDESRLMIINRRSGSVRHHLFRELPKFLNQSDLLVLNETSVAPAMMRGRKETGGAVEILALNPGFRSEGPSVCGGAVRECLVKSSKPLKPGAVIVTDKQITLRALQPLSAGRALIQFPCPEESFLKFLDDFGETPLPPYIKSGKNDSVQHRSRYQTVYSSSPGSIAAPTAGLHFTDRLLEDIQGLGITTTKITLHVGIGTFMPMRSPDIREHKMETEFFEISEQAAATINSAIKERRRIVAVGSTSMRTLESAVEDDGFVRHGRQYSDLFIKPGYKFRVVQALVTNFHLPRSTLLALVASFSSVSTIKEAYAEAIKNRYRFFSYGDSSLFL